MVKITVIEGHPGTPLDKPTSLEELMNDEKFVEDFREVVKWVFENSIMVTYMDDGRKALIFPNDPKYKGDPVIKRLKDERTGKNTFLERLYMDFLRLLGYGHGF